MNIPEAFSMCSPEECIAREESKEVSVFEATEATVNRSPKYWKIDHRLAITKYRRSAAGSKHCHSPRTVDQLSGAVNYLIYILVTRKPFNYGPAQPFLHTVSFVENRIRAVQVDFVRSQQCSSSVQLLLIRAQILILYLTLDTPSQQYARRFGRDLLTTALSAYWHEPDEKSLDEVLSLEAVIGVVNHFEDMGRNNKQPLLSPDVIVHLRRRGLSTTTLPLFQWTLELLSRIQLGHWRIVLDRIYDCQGNFGILARAILAPVIPRFRHHALEVYNSCFWGKVSGITGEQLSNLMCFKLEEEEEGVLNQEGGSSRPTGQEALEFAKENGITIDENVARFKTTATKTFAMPKKFRLDSFCLRLGGDPPVDCKTEDEESSGGMCIPQWNWMRASIHDGQL